ncbi:MAG TPA: FAD-dependent oxidoreductase [Devosia sp.]|nr:FAD-dependent oxidoreductase [Devosia sp.]
MTSREVAVVGAGVVGVATAYVLARAGHRVTLIDARNAPGEGVSMGNAAQLSWAYGDAMSSPSMLRHLPAISLGRDPAFKVQWQLDLDFLIWGLRFVLNGSEAKWWANTAAALALADKSRREFDALRAEVDLPFSYSAAGKLHLYPTREGFEAARSTVDRKVALGIVQHMIDREAATRIEPGLAGYSGDIAGVIHTPGDVVGDANAFCRALTDYIVRQYGVTTLFGRTVSGITQRAGKVAAVRFLDRPELAVDTIVAATASSRSLLNVLPEARSVRPVRGYSLTVQRPDRAPRVSVTDVKRKLAFASIGDRFRVAGLADIAAPGSGFDDRRFDALLAATESVFPGLFTSTPEVMRWSGERPMTPSSLPIIGPSKRIDGLFVNIGHGGLGWTLSLGSGRQIADLLA